MLNYIDSALTRVVNELTGNPGCYAGDDNKNSAKARLASQQADQVEEAARR